MPLIQVAFIFLTALLISLVITPLIRKWATDNQLVDSPDERKVHFESIPRLGGMAIFIAFLSPLFLFQDISTPFRGLILGGLIIFITGLFDDFVQLSPKAKFSGQVLACLVTVFIGNFLLLNLGDLFGTGDIVLPVWLAFPFTLFAIIGVSNALNLIDGLDGLAGGVSSIALTAFLILAFQSGNFFAISVSAALLGSQIGFLKHNLYPARIFMGDGGSLFSGFVLGVLAISLTQQGPNPVPPVLPLIVLGVPIVDTLWVMTRRVRRGTNPFIADKTHLHHKFLDLGLQHRFTVVIIYAISWFWAIMVIAFPDTPDYIFFFGYILFTCILYLGLRYLSHQKDTIPWFSRDSMDGIRQSVTYKKLVDSSRVIYPLIVLLFAIYPLTVVFTRGQCCNAVWPWAALLLGAIALSYLPILHKHQGIRLSITYLGILLIIYIIRTDGVIPSQFGHYTVYRIADMVLFSGLALTAVSIFLHEQWEQLLTSMDVLIMGATLLLAIFFLHQPGHLELPGILLRGMMYYQGLKAIQSGGKYGAPVVLSAIILMLLTIALSPLLPT